MATELVLAVPAVLMLVLTVVQFSVYAHARHVAQAVAAQAVAATRVDGANAAAGQRTAAELLAQLGPSLRDPRVSVTRTASEVTVTVHGVAVTVLPGMQLSVDVTAQGPVERIVGALPAPGVPPAPGSDNSSSTGGG